MTGKGKLNKFLTSVDFTMTAMWDWMKQQPQMQGSSRGQECRFAYSDLCLVSSRFSIATFGDLTVYCFQAIAKGYAITAYLANYTHLRRCRGSGVQCICVFVSPCLPLCYLFVVFISFRLCGRDQWKFTPHLPSRTRKLSTERRFHALYCVALYSLRMNTHFCVSALLCCIKCFNTLNVLYKIYFSAVSC